MILVLGEAAVNAASRSGVVSVRGYFRKDGTYVQPHFRSAPDGNVYNNWSFRGNINPFTGELGWVDQFGYRSTFRGTHRPNLSRYVPRIALPKTHLSHSSAARLLGSESFRGFRFHQSLVEPRVSHADQEAKEAALTELRNLGWSSDSTEELSLKEVEDALKRVRLSEDLATHGIDIDWQTNRVEKLRSMLSDVEQRVAKARQLQELGHRVNWRDYSWVELKDFEKRIQKSLELKDFGVSVDWRTNSWMDLEEIRMRIEKSQSLKRLGVDVDWRANTWVELYDLEQEAKLGRKR